MMITTAYTRGVLYLVDLGVTYTSDHSLFLTYCTLQDPMADKGFVKVAVIGSGVTGLGAAWHICRCPGYEVTVFEASDKPGGHTETIEVPVDDNKTINVDIGFIVFNKVRTLLLCVELSFLFQLVLLLPRLMVVVLCCFNKSSAVTAFRKHGSGSVAFHCSS